MNNNKYSYTFEPGLLHPHEIIALGRNSRSPFLPTSFTVDDNKITAVYDCRGFAPLSSFRIEHTSDILYILEKVLLILQKSYEYLIIPEHILLSPETVFYRIESGDVKITYIPIDHTSHTPDLVHSILFFLAGISEDLCDTFQSCLEIFAHRSRNENMDIQDMLTLVGILRRELEEKLAAIT